MTYELELYFGGEDPHMSVSLVEARTKTELETLAYHEFKTQRAEGYSFGPPVPRDKNGIPMYGEHRQR